MQDRRAGVGFRWRLSGVSVPADDIVRVRDESNLRIASMANGYDSGFATCWPDGSRLVLDAFDDRWRAARGDVETRLAVAFDGARQAFLLEGESLAPKEDDIGGQRAMATLLVAVVHTTRVAMRWFGGEVATLVRDGRIVATTAPHTLREELRRHVGVDAAAVARVANVVRTFGPHESLVEPAHLSWDAREGDCLILTSMRGGEECRDLDAVARTVVDDATAAEVAEAVIAASDGEVPFTAVAVLPIDSRPA